MRKFLVLTIKVLAFTATALWVFSFLALGLLGIPILVDLLKVKWGLIGWGTTFVYVWCSFTLSVSAIYVILRGFRFIGKWEKVGKEETLDLTEK